MKRFKTFSGKVDFLVPYPAIFVKEISSICIADLHLGFEGSVASDYGAFVPKIQFEKILNDVKELIKMRKEAKKIIINGDIKNKFSRADLHEFIEISNFLQFLSENFEEIIVVKGNHDNYIENITKKFEKVKVCKIYEEKDYVFLHGDKDMDLARLKGKVLILAHEHPSIAFYNKVGTKEKIPCFLYGEDKNKKIKIVLLPAFSCLFPGTEINIVPKEALLSPILRKVDIDKFRVLAVDRELNMTFDLPELEKLRVQER